MVFPIVEYNLYNQLNNVSLNELKELREEIRLMLEGDKYKQTNDNYFMRQRNFAQKLNE